MKRLYPMGQFGYRSFLLLQLSVPVPKTYQQGKHQSVFSYTSTKSSKCSTWNRRQSRTKSMGCRPQSVLGRNIVQAIYNTISGHLKLCVLRHNLNSKFSIAMIIPKVEVTLMRSSANRFATVITKRKQKFNMEQKTLWTSHLITQQQNMFLKCCSVNKCVWFSLKWFSFVFFLKKMHTLF